MRTVVAMGNSGSCEDGGEGGSAVCQGLGVAGNKQRDHCVQRCATRLRVAKGGNILDRQLIAGSAYHGIRMTPNGRQNADHIGIYMPTSTT